MRGRMLKLFKRKEKTLTTAYNRGGWWPIVFEPYGGAWQNNDELTRDTILAYHAIFSCVTLISSDISKLRMRMVKESEGIWQEAKISKRFRVIEKPNPWQNRIQFYENWVMSKLLRGNTYVLKARDQNNVVSRLYVLSPDLVQTQVSESGEVFYALSSDNLTNIRGQVTVPASEIIHDRFNCLFHPLVGVSPLFASGLAAYHGLKIQGNASQFFKNMSRPAGILTAPGAISDETAARLKSDWQTNFTGENIGKVAVLGDDLKYQTISLTAEQSQLVEQLKLTAEIVCSSFHVPKYKVIADAPSHNNIEALEQQYYSQCLQILIESIELCLDEGLDVPAQMGTEFDLDGLLRMDSKTQIETLGEGTIKGILSPNEARKKINQPPVEGGYKPFLQQQNWPIDKLAGRNIAEIAPPSQPLDSAKPQEENIDNQKSMLELSEKLRQKLGVL